MTALGAFYPADAKTKRFWETLRLIVDPPEQPTLIFSPFGDEATLIVAGYRITVRTHDEDVVLGDRLLEALMQLIALEVGDRPGLLLADGVRVDMGAAR